MPRPPKLTDEQKARLSRLEPALKEASRKGDYEQAKRLTLDVQNVLRATGHETRLQRAKNWLFEAALESGRITTAIQGFRGVRKMVRPTTRVYLEATVLLAIAHLRRRDVEAAKPLIREALTKEKNITSDRKRKQFRQRVVRRMEVEYLLALLADEALEAPSADEVVSEAGRLVRTSSDAEILAYLGRGIPSAEVEEARLLYAYSRDLLPPAERRLLPSPEEKKKAREVGGTVWEAVKRVIWRALCDKNNDVYKMWFEGSVKPMGDYKVIGGAIVGALAGHSIAYYALAASATAFVIKLGVDVFCERTELPGIMIERHE